MADEITVNFYRVEECGYYKRGVEDSYFANLTEVLDDIHEWINQDQPTIESTKTFNIDDESAILPVYCYDIKKNNQGDYLLITWNETETAEGAFASIRANQQVGNAQVVTTSVPNNSIPGHPSYFWFIPDHGVFATIRFGGRLTGNPGMNKFVHGFLEKFSQWVQVADGEEHSLDTEVLGYAENADDEIVHGLKPRFKSALLRKRGEIDYIRENQDRIRKLIRKDEYSSTVELKRSLFQAFFNHLGVSNYPLTNIDSTKFKYEINVKPSEDELEEIIENWQERHDDNWDDVGFEFEGEQGVRWLGSSIVKDAFEININWNNTQSVAETPSLLRALTRKKEEILRLMEDE